MTAYVALPPQEALGTYGHYRAFFSKAHGKLDGSWSFDDCDAAYVLLDGLALPEITDGMGRFLLADFVNYATRKDWDRRVMFIFDEVGSLNVPLYNIFEKVRFRQVSVVVSSQDPSGLAHSPGGVGTWDEVRRVLGNSAIKILHRCEDAHEVIRRAGTEFVAEEDYRTNEFGATTGVGTTRFREEFKIDHNDVLHLRASETFVIGPGDFERVRVVMRETDEAHLKDIYKDLERRSKEEPPPLQRRGGGPVVDSTLASTPSNGNTTTSQQKSRSTSTSKNGKQKQQGGKKGLPSPASNTGQQEKNKALTVKQASPPPTQQQHPRSPVPPAESEVQPNVDETLEYLFPDTTNQVQQAPPQPGVLPLWDEDEDLLPE